jgi:hypothetical protein
MERAATFPRFRRRKVHHFKNSLARPGDRSRPTPRRLASLVIADAFAGELTRGSIGAIPATVETENNGHIREVYGCPSWTLIEPCASRLSLILGESWKTFGRCSRPHRIKARSHKRGLGQLSRVKLEESHAAEWTRFPASGLGDRHRHQDHALTALPSSSSGGCR